VGGNWTRSSTATFTSNNRAVFFNGNANHYHNRRRNGSV
jgi:hypothetical protein